MSAGVLYLSYNGILEPLGQSQVLAYLKKLASGRRIHLVSFEKEQDWSDLGRRRQIAADVSAAGIQWHPLRYHKRPSALATAYDVAVGSAVAVRLARRHALSIVHARSYIPGLMALAAKRATGARFLFDMRGFWPEERIDGGLWPANSRLYRLSKRLERKLLLSADHVVLLTRASEAELRRFPYLLDHAPPISIIPTCADLDRFAPEGTVEAKPFTLGYVGSVGTWYLLDEMLRFFRCLVQLVPHARLLIVNRSEQAIIHQQAHAHGIQSDKIEIVAAEHRDVPSLIRRMSAGMALIMPAYSKISSAPTKVAEYLGCGIPCLGNSGVGDMEELLEGRRVGVALHDFSEAELQAGAARLVELTRETDIAQRCRKTALDLFSLDTGVAEYQRIYQRLGLAPASAS